jgi:hypothetical protein
LQGDGWKSLTTDGIIASRVRAGIVRQKENTMKTTLKILVPVKYYAFNREPFNPDAEGYVEESALIDYDRHPWYVHWEGEELVARKGFILVQADEGHGQHNWYAVAEGDIFTAVTRHDGLSDGYGLAYPGGRGTGLSATSYYDATFTDEDGDEILLQRHHW